MKCPNCSDEMLAGKTHIGGGSATFLFGGVSQGNLTFTADKWSAHILQDTSDVLPAHYCDGCGTLTIESTRKGLSTLENT